MSIQTQCGRLLKLSAWLLHCVLSAIRRRYLHELKIVENRWKSLKIIQNRWKSLVGKKTGQKILLLAHLYKNFALCKNFPVVTLCTSLPNQLPSITMLGKDRTKISQLGLKFWRNKSNRKRFEISLALTSTGVGVRDANKGPLRDNWA